MLPPGWVLAYFKDAQLIPILEIRCRMVFKVLVLNYKTYHDMAQMISLFKAKLKTHTFMTDYTEAYLVVLVFYLFNLC